jgi:hypothetical protein
MKAAFIGIPRLFAESGSQQRAATPSQFGLPIPPCLKQNPRMENESDKPVGFQGLVQWAMTPPQAYMVYFVCLVLIGGLSFYAGTMNPKKIPSAPPAVTAPHG